MASVRILVLLEIYAYQNAKKSSIFAAAEKPTFIQSLFNKSPFMKQNLRFTTFQTYDHMSYIATSRFVSFELGDTNISRI